MRYLFLLLVIFLYTTTSFKALYPSYTKTVYRTSLIDSLRYLYERSPDRWPQSQVDKGIKPIELGIIPGSPLDPHRDSLQPLISLGETLFFDPRLSSSNEISCATCHDPKKGWTDGLTVGIGHNQQKGTRNTQTIQNAWIYQQFFWDGRAKTLEEQAIIPIENPVEMHQNFAELPNKLSKVKGYAPLFSQAFGSPEISGQRITKALAVFQQSISSTLTDFDYFLAGDSKRLTDEQILGLHLFRTKALCMNCHNGPYLTDGKFHHINTSFYKDPQLQDLGLYEFTKKPSDSGKFRTPSLRNVAQTGPWLHNGYFTRLSDLMVQYNMGMRMMDPVIKTPSKKDPLLPVIAPELHALHLNSTEINALLAFLESLNDLPTSYTPPVLPQ